MRLLHMIETERTTEKDEVDTSSKKEQQTAQSETAWARIGWLVKQSRIHPKWGRMFMRSSLP